MTLSSFKWLIQCFTNAWKDKRKGQDDMKIKRVEFPFVRTSIEHLAKWHCLTFKSASKKPSKKRKKAAMPRSCVQHGRCLFPVFVPILLFA